MIRISELIRIILKVNDIVVPQVGIGNDTISNGYECCDCDCDYNCDWDYNELSSNEL